MDPQKTDQVGLSNDTVVNVAALLREQIGSYRFYRFSIDRFRLDDDLDAEGLTGSVRLTRISEAVLVAVIGTTSVELECQRCLNQFVSMVPFEFDEPFRIAFDVRRGTAIESGFDGIEEFSEISENHELDFGEPMRQEIIVALPMRPVCGPDCPGPPAFADDDEIELSGKFAALASLLGPTIDE